MEEIISEFIEEGKKISNFKWIKSISNKGSGAAGITYESLLGKEIDNFEWADYHGIELKTKLKHSKSLITMFTATPDNNFFEIKRIHEKYGYPDKKNSEFNVFNITISAGELSRIRDFNKMTLYVDYEGEKVILLVFNRLGQLIDNNTSWSFQMLREKLERKMEYLAIIRAEKMWKNKNLYFKYEIPLCYKLKGFNEFLELIESGDIKITFKISVFKSGARYGQIYDHGTSFDLKEEAIQKLYDKV